jgi:hypothetical protein
MRKVFGSVAAGESSSAEAPAKMPATSNPNGVAITKPRLRPTKMSGVAKAWSAKNPALAEKASDTRKSRRRGRRGSGHSRSSTLG